MRIGIDARMILSPKKSSEIGVGHYTYQLIRHLLEIDKRNKYVLFFDSKVRRKDVKKFSNKKIKNVEIRYFPWSDYKKYLPGFYSKLMELSILQKAKLDVLHVTSPDIRVPFSYRGKIICTFQNLSVYQWPDLFSRVDRLKAKYNRRFMANETGDPLHEAFDCKLAVHAMPRNEPIPIKTLDQYWQEKMSPDHVGQPISL